MSAADELHEKMYMAVLQYRGGKILLLRYDCNAEFCQQVGNFCSRLFAHYRIAKNLFNEPEARKFADAMKNLFDYGTLVFEIGPDQRWSDESIASKHDNCLDAYLLQCTSLWRVETQGTSARQAAQSTQVMQVQCNERLRTQKLLLRRYTIEYGEFAKWCTGIALDDIRKQLYPTLQCIVFVYFYLDLLRLCTEFNGAEAEAQTFLRCHFYEFENLFGAFSDMKDDLEHLQRCTSIDLARENQRCQRIMQKKYTVSITPDAFDFLRHAIAMQYFPGLVRAKIQAHVDFVTAS
jgi:hypothetical protein